MQLSLQMLSDWRQQDWPTGRQGSKHDVSCLSHMFVFPFFFMIPVDHLMMENFERCYCVSFIAHKLHLRSQWSSNLNCRCFITKSSYTGSEDFSDADAVHDCIGDEGDERFSLKDASFWPWLVIPAHTSNFKFGASCDLPICLFHIFHTLFNMSSHLVEYSWRSSIC